MADTGPCGPCSEVHYDLRSAAERGTIPAREEFERRGEAGEFLELWNLVFMQFDRDASGTQNPLPAPSIDTGLGLERLAAVMQGVGTNYHTDLFLPLLERVAEVVGRPYDAGGEEGVSYRVLADHARAVAFLLADGVFPSNEGRGYVLRRILRRGVRHAWLLGRREPTLTEVVTCESCPSTGTLSTARSRRNWGNLASLKRLDLSSNAGLCVPGTERFGTLVSSLAHAEFSSWCNEADVAVLEALHASAGGKGWENEAGWLDGTVLADWHGVTADSLGRVTALDLADNGLAGVLPASLGELARLRKLRLGRNRSLRGRLPAALARLSLDVLDYAGTTLCAPAEAAFRAWLAGIGTHAGTDLDCGPLTDHDVLEALYSATGGQSWARNTNWLTDKPLGEWSGVSTDSHGRVTWLNLQGYDLDGLIPPELGSLASLRVLYLQRNALSGPIPPELGNLASLEGLLLYDNALDGPIPAELGDLAGLQVLSLSGNALSGPIPPELGSLAGLERLSLSGNDLSGEVPPELGNLAALERLHLNGKAALEGALPAALTGMRALDVFNTAGTGLCAPSDPVFLEWLGEVRNSRVRSCAGAVAAAYMTQAVQSRDFPVPLVAGEEALLRVFVTASDPGGATLPPVRARFYLDGAEVRAAEIPATPHPIPEEVDEGTLAASANAKVPGDFVRPGLELVIEVDPEGTLDPALGAARRIPAEGRLAVDVREMPVFDLTVIPFL